MTVLLLRNRKTNVVPFLAYLLLGKKMEKSLVNFIFSNYDRLPYNICTYSSIINFKCSVLTALSTIRGAICKDN